MVTRECACNSARSGEIRVPHWDGIVSYRQRKPGTAAYRENKAESKRLEIAELAVVVKAGATALEQTAPMLRRSMARGRFEVGEREM